jgi:hypothetical protein
MKISVRFINSIIAALLLLTGFTARAGDGVWTTNGPDGGGLLYLAVSAQSPDRVYAASSKRAFRSNDSGSTWQMMNTNNIRFIRDIYVSPTSADVIYINAFVAVFRSTNGGATFNRLNSFNFGVVVDVELAGASTIYVSTQENGLYKSMDNGVSWTQLGVGTVPNTLGKIAVDPTNNSRLWVSACQPFGAPVPTVSALYSIDGGQTFAPSSHPGTSACAVSAEFSPFTPGLLMVTTSFSPINASNSTDLVLRSTDAGATFTSSTIGSPLTQFGASFTNMHFIDATQMYLGTAREGFFKSADAGVMFSSVGPSFSPTLDSTILATPRVLTKPGDAQTTYTATGDGFYRSTSSNVLWDRQANGIRATEIRAVAVNPFSGNGTVLAGNADGIGQTRAIYRSTNSAATWVQQSSASLDTVRSLLIDTSSAAATSTVYAAGQDRFPNSVSIGLQQSPLVKSIDGGATWTHLASFIGMTPPGPGSTNPIGLLSSVNAIVPDTTVILSQRWGRLFLAARGRVTCSAVGAAPVLAAPRFWRTLNAGGLWDTVAAPGSLNPLATGDDGLPKGVCAMLGSSLAANHPVPNSILVDPVNPNIIYVGTYLSYYEQGLPLSTPTVLNGVFKSTDGGATFSESSTGFPRYSPTGSYHGAMALAMDPNNRNTLYAAVNPAAVPSFLPGTVYKSTNAGATWTFAGSGLPNEDIRALAVDPTNSLRVYAASGSNTLNPGGVFVTENGGATWNSISAGLPFGGAHALTLKGDTLYAGTDSGVAEFTRISDGDSDGISNVTEQTGSATGDANFDGIQDATQSNVATAELSDDVLLANRALRGRTNYIVDSSPSLRGANNCEQLYDVVSVPPESFAEDRDTANYPFGSFRFELASCTTTTVKLRFQTPMRRDIIMRGYGPTTQGDENSFRWFTLPSSLSADRLVLSFTLTDSQLGDARRDTGRILFQGGPAYEAFANGFE